MQQGARDGGAAMPWMDGMQQGARDGGAAMSIDVHRKAAVKACYFISRNEFH